MKNFIKDNLVVIIVVLSFLLVIGIGIALISMNMQKTNEDIEKQVQYVDVQYELFSEESSLISSLRTDLYSNVFNNMYFIDFPEKNELWKEKFNEYYEKINNVYDSYKEILDVCSKYNFIYENTKYKCESISNYYEILINNYTTDYKMFNENIDNYNKWVDSNTEYNKIESFVSENFTEYVDYNKNGEIDRY